MRGAWENAIASASSCGAEFMAVVSLSDASPQRAWFQVATAPTVVVNAVCFTLGSVAGGLFETPRKQLR